MDWILSLIPGGGLTALIGGAGAIIVLITTWLLKAEKAGVNKQKVKEAEARARNLEKIKSAMGAKPTRSVHDDPANRDNWEQ